ncbi:MAG: OsmC family protein [Acidimicrobiales bacterium]
MAEAKNPREGAILAEAAEPAAASTRHGRHPILPVRVNVAGDGSMSARNTRGGELPIGTGWEGEGFNPIEMLLAAVGGCAAIDFTTVLARRGHPLSGLDIEVRGRRASDERLEAIEVRYVLPEGSGADPTDVEVARRLTADVLCTVSRTVEHSSPVEYLIVEELSSDNEEARSVGVGTGSSSKVEESTSSIKENQ